MVSLPPLFLSLNPSPHPTPNTQKVCVSFSVCLWTTPLLPITVPKQLSQWAIVWVPVLHWEYIEGGRITESILFFYLFFVLLPVMPSDLIWPINTFRLNWTKLNRCYLLGVTTTSMWLRTKIKWPFKHLWPDLQKERWISKDECYKAVQLHYGKCRNLCWNRSLF